YIPVHISVFLTLLSSAPIFTSDCALLFISLFHDPCLFIFFFFNDTATTEIYTLSLHDALPIYYPMALGEANRRLVIGCRRPARRSEEHTSELQSRSDLVCRLLLEKKKNTSNEEQSSCRTVTIKRYSERHSPRLVPLRT